MKENSKILVIGQSDVGKTHYGAKLLMSLNQKAGVLQMNGMPSNLEPFEEAMQRLNQGLAAKHTSSSTYEESIWPLIDSLGHSCELIWPDYAGEQVTKILDTRRVPSSWADAIGKCDAWILFLRLNQTSVDDDLFSRPLADIHNKSYSDAEFCVSPQAKLVELLQIFLAIRKANASTAAQQPHLMVFLSCWDELTINEENATPSSILANRLPLFSDFVKASWEENSRSILGLSALGRPLEMETPDDDYCDQGPEKFGYIVRQNGAKDEDLTLPIANLIGSAC